MTIHTRMERLLVACFAALLLLLTVGLLYTAVALNTIQTNQTNSFWFIALAGFLFVLLITLIKSRFMLVHPTQ